MIEKPVRRTRLRRFSALALATLAFYLLAAYVVLPWRWTSYERARPGAQDAMVTRTAEGIPGDPINISLVGSEADVLRAMHAAGWSAADPVTWKSSLEITSFVNRNSTLGSTVGPSIPSIGKQTIRHQL